MIEVNESEDIKAQLKADGKVTYLDKPEDIAAIAAMNERMEAVRKEFQVKDRNSQLKASKVVLTA